MCRWGAHAPSRVSTGALAGRIVDETMDRDDWVRLNVVGGGANHSTRGRVCSPIETESLRLIGRRRPKHGIELSEDVVGRAFVAMAVVAGAFFGGLCGRFQFAGAFAEAEVSPAFLESFAVLHRRGQADEFLLKRALQPRFVFRLGGSGLKNQNRPFGKSSGFRKLPISRRVDIDVLVFGLAGLLLVSFRAVFEPDGTAHEDPLAVVFRAQ